MSSIAHQPPASRTRIQELYAPIAEELLEVEEILKRELRSRHAFVDETVKHGFRLGGKRLRPALLLLAAKALGPVRREHLVLAAVVEMIHTATLVHDDILDQATIRRHLVTANSRWGNQVSVLLGDFLFSHSFFLASTLGDAFACELIGRSTNIVCEGEMRQIDSQAKFGLTEAEYVDIVDCKTAELCACCCALAAHIAGVPTATRDAMESYGRSLGIAFQIVDDLLDLTGDEDATGKSLGTDLDQRKPTLPLIRLLEQAPAPERDELIELMLQPDAVPRQILEPWLQRTDCLEYTRQTAARFARQAVAALAGLPASPALSVLERLPRFVIERRT